MCNQESLKKFKIEIAHAKIYTKRKKHLTNDPNTNYEMLSQILEMAKNKHIPKKVKQFNKRKHGKEGWMTNELLTIVVKRNKLYVAWKTILLTNKNYEIYKARFKDHDKEVKNDIVNAKKRYYYKIIDTYRSDMKKTWKTIMEH